LAKKKAPKIVISDGDKEKKIEVATISKKKKTGPGMVDSDFEPRIKEAGDIILSEDWNEMQEEIKDDIMGIIYAMEELGDKSSTMLSSGIASHGGYVELNWDVKPHVMLSLSGTVDEPEGKTNIICYPHDISSQGFRIFAQSRNGEKNGIVNWIAIGVA